ncbi:hydroxypyruvate isomerase family protein [Xanthobacter sp. TB0139]|uniref:hydroxypyruvate isomerase family protein n=1 Tax=Xanthobacter sp. TB0139 TaxID=3459178 RepID=UPI00403990C0
MQFSANLGFLWNDLPLPDAIRAAAQAGFDAVECHWPYDTPAGQTSLALEEAGLAMLGLNTSRGKTGENGLSALPGRVAEARAAIDRAVEYAVAIRAQSVHVMAGVASGPEAHDTFCCNLQYACARAAPHGLTILIEPLNIRDAPGYFLRTAQQAADIIQNLGLSELRLMFDCYHQQITGGDICCTFERLLPIIGHVQIASVPARSRPDEGELDYSYVLARIGALGWSRPVGAEYRARSLTEHTLGWLPTYRAIPVRPSPQANA